MFEKYPKGGKTTHKSFGTEKGASFVPGADGPEYQQRGSKTSYPKKAAPKSSFDMKSNEKTFASAGKSALVSAKYPRKLHQNGFDTGASNTLKAPMSDAPKEA